MHSHTCTCTHTCSQSLPHTLSQTSQCSFLFFTSSVFSRAVLSWLVWGGSEEKVCQGRATIRSEEEDRSPQGVFYKVYQEEVVVGVGCAVTFPPQGYLPDAMGAFRGVVGVERGQRHAFERGLTHSFVSTLGVWVEELQPDKPDFSWWISEGNSTLKLQRLLSSRCHTLNSLSGSHSSGERRGGLKEHGGTERVFSAFDFSDVIV